VEAKGKVFKYGDNVDTDVIIQARYLNVSSGEELAKYCMIDIDPDFVNNMNKGDIIVATKNFGCGSSREHAPLAIKCAGVSCVIASTFARIFYRNAINIGMPILECEEAANDIENGNEVSINFDTGVITNITKNKTEDFRVLIDTANGATYKIAERIFKILSTIIEYEAACIYFHSPDGSTKKRLIFDKQGCKLKDNVYLDIWRQVLPDFIEDFEIEKVTESTSENIVESADEFQSRKEFDFYYENNLIGKVCFYSTQNVEWNKLKFMPTAKSELDLYLRLKFLYVKTCYLSITDELTKLYTRRHLDSVIIQEFERAKRYGTIISVAMADIDNFKMINDTYGHQAGDYVLREVSKIFIDTLRKTDFVYRYGGEEICILMPETCIQNVIMPLERIRKNIENKQFIHNNQQIQVTISVGATTYAKDMRVPSDLIEKADAALYKAKKTGKNKVVIENE